MWRFLFLSILTASLSLNIYLLLRVTESSLIGEAFNQLIDDKPLSSKIKPVNDNAPPTAEQSSLSTIKINAPANFQQTDLVVKIKQAIDAQQYFFAANLLYDIPLENPKILNTVKTYWFNNATNQLKNKQYNSIADSIDAFLGYSPDDLDFLFLVVELKLAKLQVLEAVKKAFSLQYHTFDIDLQQQSISYAEELVRKEIKRLIRLSLWFELVQFAEEVLSIDVNNMEAQWALAQAQFQQGKYDNALESLDSLLDKPNYQVKANHLLKNIQFALQRPVMVPLTRKGEHFIVEGIINNRFSVDLLIDTGASISLLSQTVFDELLTYTQVKYIDDIVLNTAGGEVSSSIYEVDEFELAGYRVKNLKFAVSPLMSLDNKGLLGMNFLRLFDFHIDQTNNLLSLESKPEQSDNRN